MRLERLAARALAAAVVGLLIALVLIGLGLWTPLGDGQTMTDTTEQARDVMIETLCSYHLKKAWVERWVDGILAALAKADLAIQIIPGPNDRITYDDDGTTLDEIVSTGCTVHLEGLDTDQYWMSIREPGGREIVLNWQVKGAIMVDIEADPVAYHPSPIGADLTALMRRGGRFGGAR